MAHIRQILWSLAPIILVLVGSNRSLCGQTRLNETVTVVPQVAKGDLVETVIVFLNTAATAAEVAVVATDARLLEPMNFELAPFERREVKIDGGGDLVNGAVRVQAENTLSVEGRILRRLESPGDIVSQVTVLAEPLHSQMVIPISYRTGEIDNTGIAIYFDTVGMLRTYLYDAAGNLVSHGGGVKAGPLLHSARFIDEMMAPGLLSERFTGSLRIEFTGMGMAATALYTQGAALWTSRVQEVKEAKSQFEVYLEPGVDQSIFGELSIQYGFQWDAPPPGFATRYINCTDDVARALERDPRVKRIFGAVPIGFF